MDKLKIMVEPVRFNYLAARGKYFILTDKTGYPSAEFRFRSGKGVIVHDSRSNYTGPSGP